MRLIPQFSSCLREPVGISGPTLTSNPIEDADDGCWNNRAPRLPSEDLSIVDQLGNCVCHDFECQYCVEGGLLYAPEPPITSLRSFPEQNSISSKTTIPIEVKMISWLGARSVIRSALVFPPRASISRPRLKKKRKRCWQRNISHVRLRVKVAKSRN